MVTSSKCKRSTAYAVVASLFTDLVQALPIPATAQSTQPVDSAQDTWAEAISGVGPLVLLIGERHTKQLLREIRGLHNILGLAPAPLGLICVLVSLIRVAGGRTLRGFLGYEHETRINAALEVTRVNCGGVHAQLIDGFITRSTMSDPPSQALAVVLFQGSTEATIKECLKQIRAYHNYQVAKEANGCPAGAGEANWCFRVRWPATDAATSGMLVEVLSQSLDLEDGSAIHPIARSLESSASPDATAQAQSKVSKPLIQVSEDRTSPDPTAEEKSQAAASLIPGPNFDATFLLTFEGVSELSGQARTPIWFTYSVAIISFAAMLTVQLICLWQVGWFASGWMLMFAGYFGICIGVASAAYLIFTSCDAAQLAVQQTNSDAELHGILISSENTDSMDTTGSRLWTKGTCYPKLEAIWFRQPTAMRFRLTWVVSIFLSLSFACHYLGLRSTKWWVSVAELLICLGAALARSLSRSEQDSYTLVDGVNLDKRCYSTGIISCQRALKVGQERRIANALDLRIYSFHRSDCNPLSSEHLAFRAAQLCLNDAVAADRILKATGMQIAIVKSEEGPQREVVLAFNGGVLTEQGLAFPNTRICIGFPTRIEDLAAPTPLLARGIMRQPQWIVEYPDVKKENLPFLGGTYITTFDSLITWWTFAEDRNDMGDQHKNLHGSFLLINTAFFIALLRCNNQDPDVVANITLAHSQASDEDIKHAAELVDFFSAKLVTC